MTLLNWYLELAKTNVFLALIVICSVYYLIKFVVYTTPNRIIRGITMAKNGYPPPHCDADGDFKPEKEGNPHDL